MLADYFLMKKAVGNSNRIRSYGKGQDEDYVEGK
jgi:hypothetical protein